MAASQIARTWLPAVSGVPDAMQDASLRATATMARFLPCLPPKLVLLLSIFIGIISGLLVVSFRMAIDWVNELLLGSQGLRQLRLLVVPTVVGLIITVLTRLRFELFPHIRQSWKSLSFEVCCSRTWRFLNRGHVADQLDSAHGVRHRSWRMWSGRSFPYGLKINLQVPQTSRD
jgi:hypothetical protein